MVLLHLQGAHFAQDNVNRPGMSKLFFEHAKEERDHAIKLADYLSMRGDQNTNYLQPSFVRHRGAEASPGDRRGK